MHHTPFLFQTLQPYYGQTNMSNYRKKYTKPSAPKETPTLDKIEQKMLNFQDKLMKLTDPRNSIFGRRKPKYDPTIINYGGFNDRMFASSIDSLTIIMLFHTIMFYIARVFFGNERAAILYGGLLGRPTQEIIETFRTPGFLNDWLLNNVLYLSVTASLIIFLWIHTAASFGKWVARLRVVDATTGCPPTLKQSIKRYLCYFVSLAPLGLGFFWMIRDPKKQAWHDKIANTVVIRVPNWKLKYHPDSFFPNTQKNDETVENPDIAATENSITENSDDKTLAS